MSRGTSVYRELSTASAQQMYTLWAKLIEAGQTHFEGQRAYSTAYEKNPMNVSLTCNEEITSHAAALMD